MTRRKPEVFQSNGRAFIYLRVSTTRQKDFGVSLDAQAAICRSKAESLGLTIHPDRQFADSESAYKTPLRNRINGRLMMGRIGTGDTLIIARLDRAFRSVSDFLSTSTALTDRGVRLVVCAQNIDLGTATGRAQAQFLAILAEWESSRKGERIKAALAAKRKRDGLTVRTPPKAGKAILVDSDWRPAPKSDTESTMKPGRIFIYSRCSHRDSTESGLGLLTQTADAQAKAAELIALNPLLEVGTHFQDLTVSALKTNLRERPEGKLLDAELRDGDAVVFGALDRGFRNARDLANTVFVWLDRGIRIHFAYEQLSMSDATGRLMASAIVAFAQYEAEITADRNREARAQLVSKGRYPGGGVPPFWKLRQSNGKRKLVLDRRQIAAFRLIELYRRGGMTLNDALGRCEVLLAKRQNRPALPSSGVAIKSKLSALLPKSYERDKRGLAFPMFTRGRYHAAKEHYPMVVEAMRKR